MLVMLDAMDVLFTHWQSHAHQQLHCLKRHHQRHPLPPPHPLRRDLLIWHEPHRQHPNPVQLSVAAVYER